jgi:2-keto-4-pentenoate hydratase/2-oxohepta-3-ene-1,7-dioic acid hydratase in catechol pathway
MKLLRYGARGQEKPGLLDSGGRIRDLSAMIADISPDVLSPAALNELRAMDPASLPVVPGAPRIGPCVARVPQLVCTGLNYVDHVKEAGAPFPPEPVIFLKSISAINGPYDDVVLPKGSKKADWETELGIVIGTAARNVSEGDALRHIAGYCIANDISDRGFQFERGEPSPAKGKCADTFAPIGPYLVTSDEVPDPQALEISCQVNGSVMQQGSTRNMIFSCAFLLSYISDFVTLQPGDIVLTGTPAGTGLGQKPPRYLVPGDTMRLAITGLGEQRSSIVANPEE